jgi:hypothetical protein
MDKREQRVRLQSLALLTTGIALVVVLIIISRGGIDWFTRTAWGRVSPLKWAAITSMLGVALVVQFWFLMLLRYSPAKILLWLLPVIWLFNNALAAIQNLLDSSAGIAITGWIPITDLIGWLTGAVYFPLLVGGGAATALIDSSGVMLTQACRYAGIAFDTAGIAPGDIISGILNYIKMFWNLISESFMREIAIEYSKNRSFFDFSLSGAFSLPHWLFSVGYSFTCIIF